MVRSASAGTAMRTSSAARSLYPVDSTEVSARLLVLHLDADHEPSLGLTATLRDLGHHVEAARIERDTVERLDDDTIDLVIVVRTREAFGMARLCAELHESLDARIVVVDYTLVPSEPVTPEQEQLIVRTLEGGADDYLSGHDSVALLRARIRATLRSRVPRPRPPHAIEIGDVVIDLRAHALFLDGEPVECRPLQFDILAALAAHPDELVTRSSLIATVWGMAPDARNAQRVRIAMSVLRQTLGTGPNRPRIETIAGVGYLLRSPAAGGESGRAEGGSTKR